MISLVYPRTPYLNNSNNRIVREISSSSKGKFENEQELLRKRATEMYLPPGRLTNLSSTPIVVPQVQKPSLNVMHSIAKKYIETARDSFEAETYQYDLAVKNQLENDIKQIKANKKFVDNEATFRQLLYSFPSRQEAEDVLRTVEETNNKLKQIKDNFQIKDKSSVDGKKVEFMLPENKIFQYEANPKLKNPFAKVEENIATISQEKKVPLKASNKKRVINIHNYYIHNPSAYKWTAKKYVRPGKGRDTTTRTSGVVTPAVSQLPSSITPMTTDDLTIFAPVEESEPPWKRHPNKVPYSVMKNFTKQIIKDHDEPIREDYEYFDDYQPVPIKHIPKDLMNKLYRDDPKSCFHSEIQVSKLVGKDLARNYDKPWLTNTALYQKRLLERQQMNERIKARNNAILRSKWSKSPKRSKNGYSPSAAISMGLKPLESISTSTKLHQMKPPRPMLHELDKAKFESEQQFAKDNALPKKHGYTPPVFTNVPWNPYLGSSNSNKESTIVANAKLPSVEMKEKEEINTNKAPPAVIKSSKSSRRILNSNSLKLSKLSKSKSKIPNEEEKGTLDNEGNLMPIPLSKSTKRSSSKALAEKLKNSFRNKNSNTKALMNSENESKLETIFDKNSEDRDMFLDVDPTTAFNMNKNFTVGLELDIESKSVPTKSVPPAKVSRKRKTRSKNVKKNDKKLSCKPAPISCVVEENYVDVISDDDSTPYCMTFQSGSKLLSVDDTFDDDVKETQIATEEWVAYVKAKKRQSSKRHTGKKLIPNRSTATDEIDWMRTNDPLIIEKTKGTYTNCNKNDIAKDQHSTKVVLQSAPHKHEPAKSKSLDSMTECDSKTGMCRVAKRISKEKVLSSKRHFNEINPIPENIKERKQRAKKKVTEYKEMRKNLIHEIKHEVATVSKTERKYDCKISDNRILSENSPEKNRYVDMDSNINGNSNIEGGNKDVITNNTISLSEGDSKEIEKVANKAGDKGSKEATKTLTLLEKDSKIPLPVKESRRKYKARVAPGLATVVEDEE